MTFEVKFKFKVIGRKLWPPERSTPSDLDFDLEGHAPSPGKNIVIPEMGDDDEESIETHFKPIGR